MKVTKSKRSTEESVINNGAATAPQRQHTHVGKIDEEIEDAVASSDSTDSSVDSSNSVTVDIVIGEESESDARKPTQPQINSIEKKRNGSSALFAPYRTLGIVSSSAPFHLCPNENSSTSFVCCSLGDRFCLYKTQHLQPILVSQTVPCGSIERINGSEDNKVHSKSKRNIDFVLNDQLLSITIVAHGPENVVANCSKDGFKSQTDSVTLYRRTRAVDSIQINKNSKHPRWVIQGMVYMGRVKQEHKSGEKEGKFENTAIVAVVCSKLSNSLEIEEETFSDDNNSTSDDDSSFNRNADSPYPKTEDDENCMCKIIVVVASRTNLKLLKTIPLTSIPNFRPSVAIHPATYLNKIILAGNYAGESSHAAMCLVNIWSGKVIHSFACLPKTNGTRITALEQSPSVDTIAVGTNRGDVHLINILHDKKLFTLRHKGRDGASNVRITSLTFRNDGTAVQYDIAPMAVGRSDGTITVWDLTTPSNEQIGRSILFEAVQAHPGGVAKVQYMPQEPLLLSTGIQSNSIVIHIFDNPDHSGRILRQRKGHTAPPCHIRYLNSGLLANAADGTDPSLSCQILSTGGMDRTLRVFSTVRTVLDKEYSQGKGLQKRAKKLGLDFVAELLLPPVKGMAICQARSRDWSDLVTIHKDHAFAYAWNTKQGSQSGPIFKQPNWNISTMKQAPPTASHATTVAISVCGNFVLIGTKGGIIYKYNIQSGLPRGTYPKDALKTENSKKGKFKPIGDVTRAISALEKKMKLSNRKANLDQEEHDLEIEANRNKALQTKLRVASHEGYQVVGLAVDAVNKTLISVGSDSKLILWNFSSNTPHKKSPSILPAPATQLCLFRESELAAIALNDYSIIIFDCNSMSIVRHFGTGSAKHSGAICDLDFSPDGRNLYSASLDSTIRVWDVPTNSCIDWLGFLSPPTSLSVSPTGEYLATTHAGSLGISLWSDRSYYQHIQADGREITTPFPMDEPVPIGDVNENDGTKIPTDLNVYKNTKSIEYEYSSILPKISGMITLSGLPPSHWKNLFHLELVKERNKPEEAPKKPPTAPFFLQWRKGEDLNNVPEDKSEPEKINDNEDWAAAWSDDGESEIDKNDLKLKTKGTFDGNSETNKRQKVKHFRSHLASLLEQCSERSIHEDEKRFQEITDYIATLGPSAIDVALSTLCHGMHDLEEGMHLLTLTSRWLKEACDSCERFEAVNAYLHRFLHIHSCIIAGIDEEGSKDENVTHTEGLVLYRAELLKSLRELRNSQKKASNKLAEKTEHTLCLLRHFSRMI